MVGLVPLLIFLHEASINTFLDLALDFFNLFLRSEVGTTSHSRLFKFRSQFQARTGNTAHANHSKTHRASTPVNRSQVAQDTAHPTQHTERAQGEQEPSGRGHSTHKATHPAGTPVNRSQVAQDIAPATQHTERAHW